MFKCGENYSPTHKCPDKIQLHVLTEILEPLPIEKTRLEDTDTDSSDSGASDNDTEEMMKVSV
jgi:hypothetical protein